MREAGGRRPAPPDEPVAQQEIARQVADQRQLRCDGEVGAEARRLAGRIDDQTAVAVQVPDGGIDLEQRDLHGVSGVDVIDVFWLPCMRRWRPAPAGLPPGDVRQ